jgi:hypothetical protein
VAYAIATLINNLFGRSSDPFWQQAYTDLLKFVITLRRITDGYTTLSEVYQYIIDDHRIDTAISDLKAQFNTKRNVIIVTGADYNLFLERAPWKLWLTRDDGSMAHPYEAELENHLAAGNIAFEVKAIDASVSADRRHRLEAIERWFQKTWQRLDGKVRTSIVEGIVVFLSLFDENPAVCRAFCPPRSAYANPPKPGEPRPFARRSGGQLLFRRPGEASCLIHMSVHSSIPCWVIV